MSSNRLVPTRPDHDVRFPYRDGPSSIQAGVVAGSDEGKGIPWARYVAAFKRFKWLIVAVTVAGSGLGFGATNLLRPTYEVDATIWISRETNQSRNLGPIRSAELLNNLSWPELAASFAILDKVAVKERLYLVPAQPEDAPLFSSFALSDQFRPGDYRLAIDDSGRQYSLSTPQGATIETGKVGDPVGAPL